MEEDGSCPLGRFTTLPSPARRMGVKRMRRSEPLFIRTSRQLINQGLAFEEIQGLAEIAALIERPVDEA
jgi:hypothetical protein